LKPTFKNSDKAIIRRRSCFSYFVKISKMYIF